MKKLLIFLLLFSSILSYADTIEIRFTDGKYVYYSQSCMFTDYFKHPGYIWFDSYTVTGQENADWYVISDYSTSTFYTSEEKDYKKIKQMIEDKGHYCYYEEHNGVHAPDGQLYCWWFIRMHKNEIDKILVS